jgi:hypothetical protein
MGIAINQNKTSNWFALPKGLERNRFTGAEIAYGNVIKPKLRAGFMAKGIDVYAMLDVCD